MSLLGVVIAGGKSRRMGFVEKAFLPFGGQPLMAHVCARLAPQVDDFVINANEEPSRFANFGRVIVPDVLRNVGSPLAGLHAGLVYAKKYGYSAIVSVPCDAPFLPKDLVARLESPAAIASSCGQAHYLTAYWDVELLPILSEALEQKTIRRVQDWANLVQAKNIEWSSAPYDPFFNINTPDDLVLAESYYKSSSSQQEAKR